jgi:CheY-like chemotaxis protein
MAEDKKNIQEKYTPVKSILLVEDDESIGDVLVQAITQETSYIVMLARNGQDALKSVEQVKPQLLILDYQLPRMNGLELYDRLRDMKELQDVPAIMISARLPRQELKKRQITAMNKPIDLDEFLQTIEKFLA